MSIRFFNLCKILTAGLIFASTSSYAACNSDEVGYVASFKAKAGSEAAFETALSNLAAAVVKMEPGVILYAPYKGADGQYFMMERYKNEAAREAHGKAPEVTALFPALGEHMDGGADVQPVSAVCP
jgi:quinol monooxygenase YgiN